MKKCLAILLLVAFTMQCFNNSFIVLSFYANQKYIAARLCENRYRPMLHCDGKCQLAKKINQEKNKDAQNPERKLENKNEIISSRSFFTWSTSPLITADKRFHCPADLTEPGYQTDIFHPPGA